MPNGADDRSDVSKPKPAHPRKPRDAATLVIVDTSGGEPRILMGQRRADQVFLPGKFVFPGGRVDRSDHTAPCADRLAEGEVARLLFDMKGTSSAARAQALALAALRETYEETGIVVGQRASQAARAASGTWSAFHATGHLPTIAPLMFLARAITPPGRPRRYDTRFFAVGSEAIAYRGAPLDDELSGIGWFTIGEVRGLDLPNITRAVVEDLSDRLAAGWQEATRAPVPYYYFSKGSFCRRLIDSRTT